MEYEKKIKDLLRQLGIGRTYQGCDYIVYGMMLLLEDRDRLTYITKTLYPDIAKRYRTSWNCVERDIRTVVEVVWRDGDEELLKKICGGRLLEKPQNVKFFELLYEYVLSLGRADEWEKELREISEKMRKLLRQNEELKQENQKLNETVACMRNTIDQLTCKIVENES